VLSGIIVFYLVNYIPWNSEWINSCVLAFLVVYLLLYALGQRFVYIYTATAWLDALCQLATCLQLSDEFKAELAAEMGKPEAVASIRVISVASGVLHALLPRSTRWKLSLYVSRQLVVLAGLLYYAFSLRSLDSIRSFTLDSCAPFLLTFGVVEFSARVFMRESSR